MNAPETIHGLDNLPGGVRGGVVTLGNFDGVHLGHQRIVSTARGIADASGMELSAVTFDPAPAAILAPEKAPAEILPRAESCRLLLQAGAHRVVVIETTPRFLATSAEDFVRDVIAGRLAPRRLVEGPNFCFGRGRAGTVQTLRRMAGECGFELSVVDPATIDLPGRGVTRISSSLIRGLIRAGDVASAGRCLGRPYALHGRVVGGERRGRVLEFPTANVDPDALVTPADGVYAGRARINGAEFLAAISIGTKPTFGPASRVIEANLLDTEGDFYGREIALTFLARLRDQRKFPDAEGLRLQIKEDVRRVRELCR